MHFFYKKSLQWVVKLCIILPHPENNGKRKSGVAQWQSG